MGIIITHKTRRKTMFKDWAIKYANENYVNAFSRDFVKDMEHDESFPKSDNKYYILRYLRNRGACDKAIEGFKEMFKIFENKR